MCTWREPLSKRVLIGRGLDPILIRYSICNAVRYSVLRVHPQKEKQRIIWAYKILFLDVLFPMDLKKVIFVDADQIVRTDLIDLVNLDLHGAPYGYTPMGDDNTDMEGFRFWKTGYWKEFLQGLPYHIRYILMFFPRHKFVDLGDLKVRYT